MEPIPSTVGAEGTRRIVWEWILYPEYRPTNNWITQPVMVKEWLFNANLGIGKKKDDGWLSYGWQNDAIARGSVAWGEKYSSRVVSLIIYNAVLPSFFIPSVSWQELRIQIHSSDKKRANILPMRPSEQSIRFKTLLRTTKQMCKIHHLSCESLSC